MGIFPVSGSGEFLLGAPQVDRAEITLHNGNKLTVSLSGAKDGKQVDRVEFNGEKIEGYRLPMSLAMRGGELRFYMV